MCTRNTHTYACLSDGCHRMVLPHGSSSVHLSVPSFPSFSCTTEAPLPVFFPFLVEKEQINKPTNGICAYVWMSFIVGRLLHSHIPPHPYLRHMIDRSFYSQVWLQKAALGSLSVVVRRNSDHRELADG